MRPASHSTDDPPCKIDNPELAEYIHMLRRRIEVQQDFIENYIRASESTMKMLNKEIDNLSG